MLFADLVAVSQAVADTASRNAKIAALADLLRRLAPAEVDAAVAFLSGEARQGKLGIAHASLRDARSPGAATASLSVLEADAALAALAATTGKGAQAERGRQLTGLFARATPVEQDFFVRLVVGELRQGALAGLMLDAIAQAARLPPADVRRAAMFGGTYGAVARAALVEGAPGLARFSMRTMQPVLPMLAQPARDVDDALSRLGTAALEWKLDGARVQVHKAGDDVRVFTRNRNDVTPAVPEIVESVRALNARELVLDGETIALGPGGRPQPFQVTMRRFGRKLEVQALRAELPLSVLFFDVLARDGAALVDRPAAERFAALSETLPSGIVVPRLVTNDVHAAQAFLAGALARGHEGVMAKALDAPYEAGSRGASWLKVKKTHTLDLVVLAAEWGHGRRRGWLSNLHLGARDPAGGGFIMVGKTFKGLTNALLEWQTTELLAREVARDSWTVHVRFELVAEIAFNDVQASTQYPGGLALRFARVKGYRPDKRAEAADTIETVRAIHAARLAAPGDSRR